MRGEKSGVQQAVDKIGSQSELARRLGVSPQSVQQWIKRGYVPPRRVLAVTRLTGIDANSLNPESH